MATSNTVAPSSAGGCDYSNYCRTPWPLQIPWLHHLLAATTTSSIITRHGHFKHHGSTICWQLRLLPPSSNTMATLSTVALSSAGGRNYSNHCRKPWPLQIPCLHHLLVAMTGCCSFGSGRNSASSLVSCSCFHHLSSHNSPLHLLLNFCCVVMS